MHFSVLNPMDPVEVQHIENILKYTYFINYEEGKEQIASYCGDDKLEFIWETCLDLCNDFLIKKDFFGFDIQGKNSERVFAFSQDEIAKAMKNHCIFKAYYTIRSMNCEMKGISKIVNDCKVDYSEVMGEDNTENYISLNKANTKTEFYRNSKTINNTFLPHYADIQKSGNSYCIPEIYSWFIINAYSRWKQSPFNIIENESNGELINAELLTKKIIGLNKYFKLITEDDTYFEKLIDIYIHENIFSLLAILELFKSISEISEDDNTLTLLYDNYTLQLFSELCTLPNVFSRKNIISGALKARNFRYIHENTFAYEKFASREEPSISRKIIPTKNDLETSYIWSGLVSKLISYSSDCSYPLFEKCFFLLYFNAFGTNAEPLESYIKSNINEYKFDFSIQDEVAKIIKKTNNNNNKVLINLINKVYNNMDSRANDKDVFAFDGILRHSKTHLKKAMSFDDKDVCFAENYRKNIRNAIIEFNSYMRDDILR